MAGASEVRSGVAGRVYPPVPFEIEAGRATEYARSIGADPNAGVPPTFAAVYALGATAPQLFGDAEAGIDFAKLLHAEQEFEWRRPVRVGETMVSQARVTGDAVRRGVRLVSFETETTDASAALVCRSRALFVIRQA